MFISQNSTYERFIVLITLKFRELHFFCSYQDLDLRCEELIKEEFGADCNFDVHDAIKKLEKLSIVHRVNLKSILSNAEVYITNFYAH
jgi:hypothetical protein